MSSAIEIREVTKRFGSHTAVNALSLEVGSGTIYGFLGPNGAGKTTTLRMITGILTPDAGSLTVLGGQDPATVRDRLAYLPEEKGLYKDMKVLDVVSYFGELKGLKHAEAKRRAKERLEAGGLGDWMTSKCNALSKGMGQKVQVIATLLHDPDLVVLDEPFSGLDPVNAELVLELIKRYKREGRTVILSTHVVEHAEQICDSVMIIDHGHLKVEGTLSAVKAAADRTVMLDYEGDPGDLSALPGVLAADDSGQHAELKLAPDADSQALLSSLVSRVRIRRFDTREASLKQIFLNAVEEVRHEAA
ncbi:MAG: ATP-binding cassette domain-containing protein [Gammaproteobacteria bacterium]